MTKNLYSLVEANLAIEIGIDILCQMGNVEREEFDNIEEILEQIEAEKHIEVGRP